MNTWPGNVVPFPGNTRLATVTPIRPAVEPTEADRVFLGIVRELHEGELAEKVDPRETDYVSQEDHIDCAESLARDAVAADIAAAGAA